MRRLGEPLTFHNLPLTIHALPRPSTRCVVSASLSSPHAFIRHLTHASPLSWAALAYGGVMAAGVAMMLTSYGVKHGGATVAASLVPLQV